MMNKIMRNDLEYANSQPNENQIKQVNKMTQKQQLLKYFQEEDFSITTLECMQKLLILDLQGIIRDLKQDGHRIESFWISRKNMYGDIKKFKRYYLIKDDVDFVQFDREKAVLKNVVI